ncbi:uridine kinase [bacterium]|nr:uridine kinase [bacterium]
MKRPIFIGIAGGTASGKTSVAKEIVMKLGEPQKVAIITQDSYYKNLPGIPHVPGGGHNFDHPDAFDQELMLNHLQQLIRGEAVDIPVYDHKSHARTDKVTRVEPHKVLLLEGILILENRKLRELLDIKVYIDADADVRLIRRLQRDIHEYARSFDSVIESYQKIVKPMHLQFVEPSKRYADVIIPRGIENSVGVDLLITKIKSLLDE